MALELLHVAGHIGFSKNRFCEACERLKYAELNEQGCPGQRSLASVADFFHLVGNVRWGLLTSKLWINAHKMANFGLLGKSFDGATTSTFVTTFS